MQRIKQLAMQVRRHPTDSFSKFALALELKKVGDYPRAHTLFESIRQGDPDYYGVYYHLGDILERLNRRERAREIYLEGLHRIPASEARTRSEIQEALNQLDEEGAPS